MAINTNNKAFKAATPIFNRLDEFFSMPATNAARRKKEQAAIDKHNEGVRQGRRDEKNLARAAKSPILGPEEAPEFQRPPDSELFTPFFKVNEPSGSAIVDPSASEFSNEVHGDLARAQSSLGVLNEELDASSARREDRLAGIKSRSDARIESSRRFREGGPGTPLTGANNEVNDQGELVNSVAQISTSDQQGLISSTRRRINRNAAAPTPRSYSSQAQKGEHVTDPKRLALNDIDGRREARANAASQRRAETQERKLSRSKNLAYREALRRNDRAGADKVLTDARNEGIQFGGIRQHGDVGRQVADARQQGLTDAQARVDAVSNAKKSVRTFNGQRPGVTPGTFDADAGAVSQEEAGFGPVKKSVASNSHDVFSKLPSSLRLFKNKSLFNTRNA